MRGLLSVDFLFQLQSRKQGPSVRKVRRWKNDTLESALDGMDGRKAVDALRKAKEKAHLYRDIINFQEISANDPWKR
jgi:hypothetical protein